MLRGAVNSPRIRAMFYRPYISRDWISSIIARRVYLGAALTAVGYFGCRLAVAVGLHASNATWADLPAVVATFLHALLLLGVIGAGTIWFAMLYYWSAYDPTSAVARTFSIVALLLFGPFAAVIYHFAVYRPRTAVKSAAAVCNSV
jgi:hypothetical protein